MATEALPKGRGRLWFAAGVFDSKTTNQTYHPHDPAPCQPTTFLSKTPTANHRRPLPFWKRLCGPMLWPELCQAIGLCVPPAVVKTLRGTRGGERRRGGEGGKRRRRRRRRLHLGFSWGHRSYLGNHLGRLGGHLGAVWRGKTDDLESLRVFIPCRRDGPKPQGNFFLEKTQNQKRKGLARRAPL